MNRTSWLLAVVGFLFLAGGCAKRVTVPDLTFESHERVVLTMKNGEEIQGKFAPGKQVELRERSQTWSAIVKEVSEEEIVLADLNLIRTTEDVSLQASRMADARYRAGELVKERTFPRSDILMVEHLRLDVGKTARVTTFWTYGAIVLALLAGDRP
jgi:hypothetical protein